MKQLPPESRTIIRDRQMRLKQVYSIFRRVKASKLRLHRDNKLFQRRYCRSFFFLLRTHLADTRVFARLYVNKTDNLIALNFTSRQPIQYAVLSIFAVTLITQGRYRILITSRLLLAGEARVFRGTDYFCSLARESSDIFPFTNTYMPLPTSPRDAG